NWWGGTPFGAGEGARFGSAITAAKTVTLDAVQTVGTLIFDNANRYTLGGTSTLTIDTVSGSGSISVLQGSHTIAAPLTLAKNTNVNVSPSNATLTVSGALTAS